MSKSASKQQEEEEDDEMFGPMPPPPTSSAQPTEAAPASQFEPYLKRVIQPTEKPAEATSKPKKAASWIVYGQDELPEDDSENAFEERQRHVDEAMPHGEYDNDALLDHECAKVMPIRYEAYLKGHTKAISALALDPSGVRLVSAGADFHLRFWDFSSMDKSLQSFRSMEPMENNLIHTLEWTKAGDKILLAANTPQAQVLDREGRKLMETPRGYQYTTDMTHTTGHVHPITRAAWNPADSSSFASCSQDATVRFWNLENYKKHKEIIKMKTDKGLACKPLCMAFDDNGQNIAIALDDGTLQLFPTKGPYLKPTIRINDAHAPNTDTSHISFVPGNDGKLLASRGGDDTMKIWDIRNTKSALASFPMLSNRFSQTSMAFKPDGSVVATGTSNSRNGDPGSIFFFDLKNFQLMKVLDVSTESVISLRWHKTTNQLIAGTGNGTISVFFDPVISSKGVMTSINKAMRRVASQKTSEITIITPLGAQELNSRQQKAQARKDPLASHKPQNPVTGRGSDGMLGSNLRADFMKRHLVGEHDLNEDPREALLRRAHQDDAKAHLDYAGLEEINKQEQARAEAMEKARKSRERK